MVGVAVGVAKSAGTAGTAVVDDVTDGGEVETLAMEAQAVVDGGGYNPPVWSRMLSMLDGSMSSCATGGVGADAAGGGGSGGGGSGSGSCSVPPASYWRSTMAWFAALVASGMSLPRLFLPYSLAQQLVLCPTVLQYRQEFPSRLYHSACSYAGRGPGSDRFWLLGRASRSVTCTSCVGSTPAMWAARDGWREFGDGLAGASRRLA